MRTTTITGFGWLFCWTTVIVGVDVCAMVLPTQQKVRRQSSINHTRNLTGNLTGITTTRLSAISSKSLSSSSQSPLSSPSEKDKSDDDNNKQSTLETSSMSTSTSTSNIRNKEEKWEMDSKVIELVGLAVWMGTLSVFILINNFIGPWPEMLQHVPERIFFMMHMIGGMLFGGGVILTTAIEWLVFKNKNGNVLTFWFDKVPLLDAAIVLPGLTLSMFSGTGLSIVRYGGLNHAPVHIPIVFYALVAFATWWAITDLTTQGSALTQVNEWAATNARTVTTTTTTTTSIKTDELLDLNNQNNNREVCIDDMYSDVPKVVEHRTVSNVVSCLFVLALYTIMVMKPGTLQYNFFIF